MYKMSDQCVCDNTNVTVIALVISNILLSLAKPFFYKILHTKGLDKLIKSLDDHGVEKNNEIDILSPDDKKSGNSNTKV